MPLPCSRCSAHAYSPIRGSQPHRDLVVKQCSPSLFFSLTGTPPLQIVLRIPTVVHRRKKVQLARSGKEEGKRNSVCQARGEIKHRGRTVGRAGREMLLLAQASVLFLQVQLFNSEVTQIKYQKCITRLYMGLIYV